MSTVVVMPGGFHPFHAGHMALYNSALKAFPGADVYVAATNDTKTRPFPFAVKEKLAKVAGVPSGQFVQVKSPFQPREITSQFDPEKDVLIFVRSSKDKNESPTPGGTKKDGSPSYFQPYTKGQLQPFSKHAYMAYLPTVEFGPGMTSATEIREAWATLDERRKTALVMSLYPATQKNKRLASVVVKLMDSALGNSETMNEDIQVQNNIANVVSEFLHAKKQDIFTRYGDEYVMNIILDVCADAPTKTIPELGLETLQRLKREIHEAKEKQLPWVLRNDPLGDKIEQMQDEFLDMMDQNSDDEAEDVDENMVIGCCPNEDVESATPVGYDQEVARAYRFAQQHYPNMQSKQDAFVKFVLHALKHSEEDDKHQNQEIDDLEHDVERLEKKVNISESADYLEEK